MKTRSKSKPQARERRWVLFSNGCLHGVRHSEVVFTRSTPHRSFVRNSVAVFSISRTAGLLALLAALVVLFIALAGCQTVEPLRGGSATTHIGRGGQTNSASLRQSDNPKEPSQQTVESQQTLEYVLPAGSAIELGASSAEPRNRAGEGVERPGGVNGRTERQQIVVIDKAVPVRMTAKDRTETRLGAAQKDTGSDWARKAGQMQPVMWAGIAMMTLVAGVLIYFGWWTKAALAIGVGAGMVVLAQTLPEHGTAILLGGLGIFGAAALLILYAYTKGQLDKNHNGIPDFMEADRSVPY